MVIFFLKIWNKYTFWRYIENALLGTIIWMPIVSYSRNICGISLTLLDDWCIFLTDIYISQFSTLCVGIPFIVIISDRSAQCSTHVSLALNNAIRAFWGTANSVALLMVIALFFLVVLLLGFESPSRQSSLSESTFTKQSILLISGPNAHHKSYENYRGQLKSKLREENAYLCNNYYFHNIRVSCGDSWIIRSEFYLLRHNVRLHRTCLPNWKCVYK